MCGIAGIVGSSESRMIESMIGAMNRRGPDDSGIYVDAECKIMLGHRRLSIIDLSAVGHQPMSDESGRYRIVYNGEIYNYMELREELERAGYAFRSHTDTEVLLNGYREWGRELLPRLRGMFAFALLDRGREYGPDPRRSDGIPATPNLLLVRDRLGIKPLVYARFHGLFLFASELKGLLSSGQVDRILDPRSLLDYLAMGSVLQPRTILQGVHQLGPGTGLYLTEDRTESPFRYWDLAEKTRELRQEYANLPYEEHVARTRALLEEATAYHMIADVPVGAFLSGGIDSTAVVALMGRLSSRPIKSFSVGFERTNEVKDELSYAAIAAKHLNCDHTEIRITGQEIADSFDDLITMIDQPSIDGTNTYMVSRAARQQVKVSLSGLGGDELFAGYPHFRNFLNASQGASGWVDHLGARLHRVRPNRFTVRHAMAVNSVEGRLASLRSLIPFGEIGAAFAAPLRNGLEPALLESAVKEHLRDDLDPVSQTSYAECRGYLLSTLLRDADAMSMAHSLEVRPILLDHCLAEHAFALPAASKIRGDLSKAALVDAVRDLLPPSLLERPKMGFELPLGTWISGPLRERLEAALLSPQAKTIFSEPFLLERLKQAREGRAGKSTWAWFVLLEWMQRYQCGLET